MPTKPPATGKEHVAEGVQSSGGPAYLVSANFGDEPARLSVQLWQPTSCGLHTGIPGRCC